MSFLRDVKLEKLVVGSTQSLEKWRRISGMVSYLVDSDHDARGFLSDMVFLGLIRRWMTVCLGNTCERLKLYELYNNDSIRIGH